MSTAASLHDEPLQLLTRAWIKQAFVTRSPVMDTVCNIEAAPEMRRGKEGRKRSQQSLFKFFPFLCIFLLNVFFFFFSFFLPLFFQSSST